MVALAGVELETPDALTTRPPPCANEINLLRLIATLLSSAIY